jgi:hypothetical protein
MDPEEHPTSRYRQDGGAFFFSFEKASGHRKIRD